jgi:phosphoribosylanthranilate isomerase
MTQVKICGLTHLADAEAAVQAGADLLGFICYPPSPRYLSPSAIAAILAGLRPLLDEVTQNQGRRVRTVGVFVDETPATVAQVLATTGLDLAQLHGGEPPAALAALGGRGFKALRPTHRLEAEAEAEWYAELGPADGPDLLVDAFHPQAYGGTGRRADWETAAVLAARYRLLLAGGLNPANVAAAVARVRPWGVDVSSGVESAPGRKDHAALAAFIAAAKGD